MKTLDALFPLALEATRKYLVDNNNPKAVAEEYKGYASQLGAVIKTAGLMPALSFYTDIHKSPNEVRRFKLLKAIMHVMQPSTANSENNDVLLQYVLKELYPNFNLDNTNQSLPRTYDEDVLQGLKKQVLEASIAMKLAIRNFEQLKTSNS